MNTDRKISYVCLILSGMFLIMFLFFMMIEGDVAIIGLPFGAGSFVFLFEGLLLFFTSQNRRKEKSK